MGAGRSQIDKQYSIGEKVRKTRTDKEVMDCQSMVRAVGKRQNAISVYTGQASRIYESRSRSESINQHT